MAVTQLELGRRLRAAREAAGLTQDSLAAQLGISRSTVAQMELGNRAVTSLELDRIAYLLGRDIREFLGREFREEDALVALFRAQPKVAREHDVVRALRDCVSLGHELGNLEKMLGIEREPLPPAYALPVPSARWEAIQQGARTAEEERRRLSLGFTPVADLVRLLEAEGVRTGLVALPQDVSGLTLQDADAGVFVVINEEHVPMRQRFSFAHEYAHVLLDRDRRTIVSQAEDRGDLNEVRANSFAACFLMPEEGVRQFVSTLGKGRSSRMHAEIFDEAGVVRADARAEPGSQDIQMYDVVQLAHHFGVSRGSALYRLRNLRLLTDAELVDLQNEEAAGRGVEIARLLEANGSARHRAGSRGESRGRFLGLALEAYRRGKITASKFQELAHSVGLQRESLARLLADAGFAADEDLGDILLPAG